MTVTTKTEAELKAAFCRLFRFVKQHRKCCLSKKGVVALHGALNALAWALGDTEGPVAETLRQLEKEEAERN